MEVTRLSFIVVRHAEKDSDEAKDPSLSATGRARADRLAALLTAEPLVAAYATGYRRTQQTATPAASQHGVAVTLYDAGLPARVLASQLRTKHAQGVVLVVGHSNTVPDIVTALSGTAVPEIADDQFGQLYRINIAANGKATLVQGRY